MVVALMSRVEWHHDYRTAEDDTIATSHKGAGLVYLSPDPPVGESWVKIQEEAEDPPGLWYTGDKLNERKGMYAFMSSLPCFKALIYRLVMKQARCYYTGRPCSWFLSLARRIVDAA
jgi:hypothetical protein